MAQTIFIICLSGFAVTSKTYGTRMARGKCSKCSSFYNIMCDTLYFS